MNTSEQKSRKHTH